jgi:hypothetical protein
MLIEVLNINNSQIATSSASIVAFFVAIIFLLHTGESTSPSNIFLQEIMSIDIDTNAKVTEMLTLTKGSQSEKS